MSDKINIAPAIRFKSFDKNWSKIHFGSIFSFFTTNSFSRDKMNYTDGDVKNIHYGDIHTKYKTVLDFSKTIIPYINEDVSLSSIKDESYLIDGDVIIADASEDLKDIGKATEILNIGENKIVAGLHTILARDLTGITAVGFRGYLFSTNNARLQIQKKAQGISVLGISKSNISDIEIYLPSLEEQTKIANFLSAVDSKITSLERLVSHWQAYKKGIMKQIFTQQLRFKDENGKEFPKWTNKKLGDIGLSIIGLTYSPDNVVDPNDADGVLVLRSSNIQNGNLVFENNVFVKANISEKNFVKENDILICSRNGSKDLIGKNALIRKEHTGYAFGAFMTIYRSDFNLFLYHLLQTDAFFNQINQHLGATINQITTKSLNSFEFKFPIIEEQTKIANFLSSLDDKIAHLQQQLTSYRQFKKALLQQMFV